jgi:hypothetical protein
MQAHFRLCLLLLAVGLTPAARTSLALESQAAPTVGHAPGDALPPQTPGDDSSGFSIRRLQENPLAHAGTRVALLGTVVRASRQAVGGTSHSSLLLRDAHGDTISIAEPDELPPVGARVRVVGSVEILSSGIAIIGQAPIRPRVSVLEQPDDVVGNPLFTDPLLPAREAGSCENASAGSLGRTLCSMAGSSWVGLAVGLVALLGAAGAVLWRRHNRGDPSATIPLIVDLEAIRTPPAQDTAAILPPTQEASPPPRSAPSSSGNGMFTAFDDTAPEAYSTGRLRLPKLIESTAPAAGANLEAAAADGGILQLLPGRLEVLHGEGLEPEIRFFRIYSQEAPEFTFGRSEGPAYRHVRLEEPTVSRLHARLRFTDRHWKISSLSHLNPVVVNGQEIAGPNAERALSDGDRIEIGRVVFRYRDTACPGKSSAGPRPEAPAGDRLPHGRRAREEVGEEP